MEKFVEKNDLISVIVPVYNMERYLERCVNSIIQQTYKNLEIILVDDGSTDASPQMCDAYARKDSRIKVIHKTNGGLSDARNAGLAIAMGEYIGYVDSDDWIEPQMYQYMYEACVQNNAQLAVCRYAKIYQDKTLKGGNGSVTAFDREKMLYIYLCDDERYIVYNSVWSKLFAREIVEGEWFPVGRNSEDIMYTTKAFCKLTRGVYIDDCLYNYVLDREGSIMNVKRTERMFRDEIPFWREHITYIGTHVSTQLGDMAAYYFYRRMLSYYMELYAERGTKQGAKRLAKMMLEEKKKIRCVYTNIYKGKKDMVRMRVFLLSPSLYYIVNKLYETIIIPIKSKERKSLSNY